MHVNHMAVSVQDRHAFVAEKPLYAALIVQTLHSRFVFHRRLTLHTHFTLADIPFSEEAL